MFMNLDSSESDVVHDFNCGRMFEERLEWFPCARSSNRIDVSLFLGFPFPPRASFLNANLPVLLKRASLKVRISRNQQRLLHQLDIHLQLCAFLP
jgi:hypothetical protein